MIRTPGWKESQCEQPVGLTCPWSRWSEEGTGCTERCRSGSLCPSPLTCPEDPSTFQPAQVKGTDMTGERRKAQCAAAAVEYLHGQLHHHVDDALPAGGKVEAFREPDAAHTHRRRVTPSAVHHHQPKQGWLKISIHQCIAIYFFLLTWVLHVWPKSYILVPIFYTFWLHCLAHFFISLHNCVLLCVCPSLQTPMNNI